MEINNNIDSLVKQAWDKIQSSENFVLISHINSDGDSLGSQLALYHYLNEIGKNVEIYSIDKPPYHYNFLDGINSIKIYESERDKLKIDNVDVIFILDLNNLSRMKALGEAVMTSKAYKILIDHHIEPKFNADLMIIDVDASSTAELIRRMIKCDPLYKLSKSVAVALYTGIMTDTGGFRFPRTDKDVHTIAGELIEAGADPAFIYDSVYNQIPLNALRLLGLTYAGAETYYDGKLVFMCITNEMMIKTGTKEEDIENFAEKMLQVKGAKVGVLISEIVERNELRISFRAKSGYNVRDIAVKYGGGGHLEAAGARVYNEQIESIKKNIIQDFSQLIKEV